jgi:hypothetical protein
MKMMTREQLFAAPKLARRAKGRFDRGMAAVSAARARAMEIAQQSSEPPKPIPTTSHRRRLARCSSYGLNNSPGALHSPNAGRWCISGGW